MKKYTYIIGGFYSFITFMIGWGHFFDHGFEIFNIGFMAMTPIISIVLTTIYIRDIDKKERLIRKGMVTK
jgi:hypothetical protein